ncbi:hypothetical protein B0H14DRAFT_2606636 [Mycena olivaceomarginata]|nr:hypothetical protein B0H14DRAFT_2606636 [Mycena olivaceomarginata]
MVIVLGTAVDVVENEQAARGGAGMKGNRQVHKLDGCIQRVVWSQMDTSTVFGCDHHSLKIKKKAGTSIAAGTQKGGEWGSPPYKMGPAREGKSPKWAVQAQHQASYMPLQEGQWIGAG